MWDRRDLNPRPLRCRFIVKLSADLAGDSEMIKASGSREHCRQAFVPPGILSGPQRLILGAFLARGCA